MTRFARYLLPIVLTAMLGACGIKQSYVDSGKQATQFHAALSAGEYDQIWNAAAPALQQSTDKAHFTALLAAIGRKLGKVTEAKQTNWSSNTDNGVSTVTMRFDTKFEFGSGKETITYLWVTGDSLKLSNYAIDSPDMLIK